MVVKFVKKMTNDTIHIMLIKNSLLKRKLLNKIVLLKQQYWNYSNCEHKTWIKKNINNNDFHLCIFFSNEKLVAYLNIVNIQVILNNKKKLHYCGVGNVCVHKKYAGKGIGQLIMSACNCYIKKIGKPGVLLCSEKLRKFYELSGWLPFKGNAKVIGQEYKKLIMFTKIPNYNSIEIKRNF